MIGLTVVFRTSNHAATLPAFLAALSGVLERSGEPFELLVVDEASTDGTPDLARASGARVIESASAGYGAALAAAAAAARHPWLLTLEPDQSHDPAFLPRLLKARDGADLVIGSRYVRFAFADMPLVRRALSIAFNRCFRRLLSLPVHDLSSSFRLYRTAALAEVLPAATSHDALLEVLVNLDCAGYRIAEVPVHHRCPAGGRGAAQAARFARECLRAAGRLWKRRNSVFSADYDHRAFFSLVLPQRLWQRRRYSVVRELLGVEGGRIVDLGCGSSMIAMSLPTAIGVDILFRKLRYLRHLSLPLVQGALDRIPLATGAFDGVICSQVIEHVPRALVRFSEMNRLLKPGGRLVIGTPDYGTLGWNITETIYKYVMPGGYADEHVTHFTRASLTAELERAGFEVRAHRYVYTGELVVLAIKVRESPAE